MRYGAPQNAVSVRSYEAVDSVHPDRSLVDHCIWGAWLPLTGPTSSPLQRILKRFWGSDPSRFFFFFFLALEPPVQTPPLLVGGRKL